MLRRVLWMNVLSRTYRLLFLCWVNMKPGCISVIAEALWVLLCWFVWDKPLIADWGIAFPVVGSIVVRIRIVKSSSCDDKSCKPWVAKLSALCGERRPTRFRRALMSFSILYSSILWFFHWWNSFFIKTLIERPVILILTGVQRLKVTCLIDTSRKRLSPMGIRVMMSLKPFGKKDNGLLVNWYFQRANFRKKHMR